MEIELGLSSPQQSHYEQLASLIYASGSDLFDLLFGGAAKAIHFLNKACAKTNGQFGHGTHYLVMTDSPTNKYESDTIAACMTLWTSSPSQDYIDSTLLTLGKYLNTEQLKALSRFNNSLQQTLKPPLASELCIGHLSVANDFRRQGLASHLCEFAAEQAIQQKKESLVLDVQSTNHSAIECYKRIGFKFHDQNKLLNTDLVFIRMSLTVQ